MYCVTSKNFIFIELHVYSLARFTGWVIFCFLCTFFLMVGPPGPVTGTICAFSLWHREHWWQNAWHNPPVKRPRGILPAASPPKKNNFKSVKISEAIFQFGSWIYDTIHSPVLSHLPSKRLSYSRTCFERPSLWPQKYGLSRQVVSGDRFS